MDRETETIDDVFKRFLAGKKATIVFSQPSVSFKSAARSLWIFVRKKEPFFMGYM